MGSLLQEKNVNWTVVSNVTSLFAHVTNPGWTESFAISPMTAKIALGRQTSSLRVSWHGKITVGVHVVGAVLSIMASTKTPKALSEKESRAMSDRT